MSAEPFLEITSLMEGNPLADQIRPVAVVTGASTGIGYELAKCCANHGFDLVIVADEAVIKAAAADFEQLGARVDALEADLSTLEGVDKLCGVVGDRPVDALLANDRQDPDRRIDCGLHPRDVSGCL